MREAGNIKAFTVSIMTLSITSTFIGSEQSRSNRMFHVMVS